MVNVVKKALVRVGFLRGPVTCWCCEKRPVVVKDRFCQECKDLLDSMDSLSSKESEWQSLVEGRKGKVKTIPAALL